MTTEGTLVTIDGRPALRFERRFRQPVQRVWRAITEPEEMSRWFPSDVVGERAVGAALVFDDDAQREKAVANGELTRDDGPQFRGEVVAFDPPNVFSFTWGGELLRFELTEEGDGTALVFTQVLSHPSVAARNGAGWHDCIAELDRLLGAATPSGTGEDGWDGVYDDYLARMGPPLGVPSAGGAMTWERATHVDAERVRTVTSDPEELDAWGGATRATDPLRWRIEPTDHGTQYRLTHDAVGDDAELAATWHALLLQLDMYLAAGQLLRAEPADWIEPYRAALATAAP